ncbi:hypothetical protein L3X38_017704 [Prunus dulcis]|uniref:Uncharacterized protein n=1 Tax=Prunus dulcis TaxID=3755 RepID=A0AAD4W7S4_PRUDU|nr:hypothetical protein L3X38_017704 [Prunus dulcis]
MAAGGGRSSSLNFGLNSVGFLHFPASTGCSGGWDWSGWKEEDGTVLLGPVPPQVVAGCGGGGPKTAAVNNGEIDDVVWGEEGGGRRVVRTVVAEIDGARGEEHEGSVVGLFWVHFVVVGGGKVDAGVGLWRIGGCRRWKIGLSGTGSHTVTAVMQNYNG